MGKGYLNIQVGKGKKNRSKVGKLIISSGGFGVLRPVLGVLGKLVMSPWRSWGNVSRLSGGLGETRHMLGLDASLLDCLSRTDRPIGTSGVFRWPRCGVVWARLGVTPGTRPL